MIRQATLFDLNVLWEMWLALTGEEAAKELEHGREPYPRVSLQDKEAWAIDTSIALTSPTSCFLIAENAGHAVGFMVSSAQSRTVGAPRHYLFISQLYVRPAERKHSGGNIAAQLCSESERWAREHQLAQVECLAVQANIPLWESRGLRVVAAHMPKDLV